MLNCIGNDVGVSVSVSVGEEYGEMGGGSLSLRYDQIGLSHI